MPTEIPPPGTERDALLAVSLGWRYDDLGAGPAGYRELREIKIERWVRPDGLEASVPDPWSTSQDACESLKYELARRGFRVRCDHDDGNHRAICTNHDGPQRSVAGVDCPDAISAAALLALRDG